jgi:AraC family transcriptional regulator, positive regulator of tynA and feaB
MTALYRATTHRQPADIRTPLPWTQLIAHRWGFCDTSHFSRTFKAHYGYSPTDYRNADLLRRPAPDASVQRPVAQVQTPEAPREKTSGTAI